MFGGEAILFIGLEQQLWLVAGILIGAYSASSFDWTIEMHQMESNSLAAWLKWYNEKAAAQAADKAFNVAKARAADFADVAAAARARAKAASEVAVEAATKEDAVAAAKAAAKAAYLTDASPIARFVIDSDDTANVMDVVEATARVASEVAAEAATKEDAVAAAKAAAKAADLANAADAAEAASEVAANVAAQASIKSHLLADIMSTSMAAKASAKVASAAEAHAQWATRNAEFMNENGNAPLLKKYAAEALEAATAAREVQVAAKAAELAARRALTEGLPNLDLIQEISFFDEYYLDLFSNQYAQTYFGLVLYVFLALALCGLLATLAYLLSLSTSQDTEKRSEYECGFAPFDSATRLPFDVHFYLVGILFLIFDVGVALLFP